MQTSDERSNTPRFLSLPPEIRDEIYRHLFVASNCKFQTETDEFTYKFDLQIFRTCRQIYQEAERCFYARNSFACIETPWNQAEQYIKAEGMPIIASGDTCCSFTREQLQVKISSPGIERTGTGRLLIHSDDIPQFCGIWFYSNLSYLEMNAHLNLELILHNPSNPGVSVPRENQKRLVQPFGVLKGLGKFDISGDVDADILEQVNHEMAQPLDSPTDCIEKSIDLLAAGNDKVEANNPAEALEDFKEAFNAIHIIVDGKFDRRIYAERYFEALLTRPFFGNQSAGYARLVLRIKLVAAFMLAYTKLRDWEMVHHWGIRSIRLYRRTLGEGADEPGHPSFPAPTEWGQIYYRTALAAEEIGRDDDAREFYPIAKAWLPEDEDVTRSLNQFRLRTG